MKTAVYPGSLDPITFGHIDAIKDAAVDFGRVVTAIAAMTDFIMPFRMSLMALTRCQTSSKNWTGPMLLLWVGYFTMSPMTPDAMIMRNKAQGF